MIYEFLVGLIGLYIICDRICENVHCSHIYIVISQVYFMLPARNSPQICSYTR